jgi:hypothetical protein
MRTNQWTQFARSQLRHRRRHQNGLAYNICSAPCEGPRSVDRLFDPADAGFVLSTPTTRSLCPRSARSGVTVEPVVNVAPAMRTSRSMKCPRSYTIHAIASVLIGSTNRLQGTERAERKEYHRHPVSERQPQEVTRRRTVQSTITPWRGALSVDTMERTRAKTCRGLTDPGHVSGLLTFAKRARLPCRLSWHSRWGLRGTAT